MAEKVILVAGSCGLDRLLTVPTYPAADSKVRSSAYYEVGGGNAANTATAMAQISSACVFRNSGSEFRIKLLTKVGDDHIGQQLEEELDSSGVDTTYVLKGKEGSTTSFTTVIVSQQEQTRTCIHTPGTCENFCASDIQDMNELFANVVHVHSDSRLAEVSLLLAKEAHKRRIPVSVDAEKDRKVEAFNQLLALADKLFTNSLQLGDFLKSWTTKLETENNRQPLYHPVVSVHGEDDNGIKDICARAIGPSRFFQRWFSIEPLRRKEVIITKGHMGALHVSSDRLTLLHANCPPNEIVVCCDSSSGNKIPVLQYVIEHAGRNECWSTRYMYSVDFGGVLSNAHVVDTTGAGDAYIGGYILSQFLTRPHADDSVQLCLQFGAWVAGKKLGGPGARTALPRGSDVDNELGRTPEEVQSALKRVISPFNS